MPTSDSAPAPGPLEDAKRHDHPGSGQVEPQAMEVESARLLANDAKPRITELSDEEIRRLADEFVARDRGEDVDTFVAWARDRIEHHGGQPPGP